MSHSFWLFGSQLRRGLGALLPVGRASSPVDVRPELPAGETITLPGRGEVFVRRARGPEGAVPVVLLHGVTWSADINFHGVMGALARDHPVIALDQRGHGRGLPINGRFGIEDMADDAVAVLDALGVERAIFAGYSLGCLVSLHAALRHRDRIAGLVLAGGALCYRGLLRDRIALFSVKPAAVLARTGLGRSVAARYFGLNRAGGDESFLRLWPWLRAELARTPPSGVISVMAAVAQYDVRHRAESLRELPSAVVLTTRDTICNPAMQNGMAAALGSDVVLLDSDHDVPLADPTAYRDAMLDAISRVERRTRWQHVG